MRVLGADTHKCASFQTRTRHAIGSELSPRINPIWRNHKYAVRPLLQDRIMNPSVFKLEILRGTIGSVTTC
jgi:hypothetical protein